MLFRSLIIIAGAQLLKSSVEKIFKQESLTAGNVTIVILIAAILIKVWLTLFNTNISRSINSAALKATGTDSRNDVITTAVVLAGIIINKLWNINIDGYLGCVFPMLPERLSTDLTSLDPGEDRVAIVTEIKVDGEGRLVSEEIYHTASQLL